MTLCTRIDIFSRHSPAHSNMYKATILREITQKENQVSHVLSCKYYSIYHNISIHLYGNSQYTMYGVYIM